MNEWGKMTISWIEQKTLFLSIPFTWLLEESRQFLLQGAFFFDRAIVGGPAVSLMPDYFADLPHVTTGGHLPGVLQRFNPMATRTTAGCPNRCGFCGVHRICGEFVEFADWPDLPILIDDNLFAASQPHFDRVIDRLIKWQWADFNQGVDSRLLTPYHAERLAQIKKPMIRLALDNMAYADAWTQAVETLRRAGIAKKHLRSYALIGFHNTPAEAWERCQFIEEHVSKVLPMWFHPLDATRKNGLTEQQKADGWNQHERRRLFEWYYKHKRV